MPAATLMIKPGTNMRVFLGKAMLMNALPTARIWQVICCCRLLALGVVHPSGDYLEE